MNPDDRQERGAFIRTSPTSPGPLQTLLPLIIAVGCGLLAVVIVQLFVLAHPRPQPPKWRSSPVVVAARPIARGEILSPASLRVVGYPAWSVPAGAFGAVGPLVSTPHASLRALVANEPILAGALTGRGGRASLSSLVDSGLRAFTVRSGDVAGVGGFVLPGDAVDVLLTRSTPIGAVTQILASDLRVLAVDQTDDTASGKVAVARSVTLEARPEDARAIALGQSIGSISLALRRPEDPSRPNGLVTTVRDLGVYQASVGPVAGPPVARPPRPPPGMVEVRVTRGTDAARYTVGAF